MSALSSDEIEKQMTGLWTVQSICEKTGVVPQTVFNWVSEGMPKISIPGDRRDTLRFKPDEVREWVRINKPHVKIARGK